MTEMNLSLLLSTPGSGLSGVKILDLKKVERCSHSLAAGFIVKFQKAKVTDAY